MFEPTMRDSAVQHWRVMAMVMKLFMTLTKHHELHAPEKIGMFAGSLLARSAWDHP